MSREKAEFLCLLILDQPLECRAKALCRPSRSVVDVRDFIGEGGANGSIEVTVVLIDFGTQLPHGGKEMIRLRRIGLSNLLTECSKRSRHIYKREFSNLIGALKVVRVGFLASPPCRTPLAAYHQTPASLDLEGWALGS
jgi:hypothetical protein